MYQATIQHQSWNQTQAKRELTRRQNVANPNATAPYILLGDRDSVSAIVAQLQNICSINIISNDAINFDSPNVVVPEQIVQYYRSSSLALALTSYNNSASSLFNAPQTSDSLPNNTQDTPLPTGTDLIFLACLNNSVAESAPLMDATDTPLANHGLKLGSPILWDGPYVPAIILLWIVLFRMM